MTKGLEALQNLSKLVFIHGGVEQYKTIEKELEALEIIIKKNVDIRLLKGCKYAYVYNDNIGYDEEVLTGEEFDLLKEVVL